MAARRTRRGAAGVAGATATAALLLFLGLTAAASAATAPFTTTPLSSGPWSLKNKNDSLNYSDVQLPTYPHQVLQSKGVIGDPLYRYNELETRWVCDDQWTFSRDFDATPAQASAPAADLVFKGIDTFATVTLNGDVILRTDNFHRTWRVPVQGLLKAGKNALVIAIEPAEATAIRLKKELPYTVNALHQPGGMDIYNYARKGAYSFGWDWGASFPISGVHGEIDLVTYEAPVLLAAHVVSQQLVDAPDGPVAATAPVAAQPSTSSSTPSTTSAAAPGNPVFKLDVEAEFALPPQGGKGDLFVDLDLGDGRHVTATQPVDFPAPPTREREDFAGAVHVGAGNAQGERRDQALAAGKAYRRVLLDVPAADVRLWWPAGLGKQPLYNLTVSFRPASESADCGAALLAGTEETSAISAFAVPFYRRAPPAGPPPAAAGDERVRAAAHRHAPYAVGQACTAVQRRVGFRTVELVTVPGQQAAQGDLRASWNFSPAKGSPEAKAAAEAEAAAAAGKKPPAPLTAQEQEQARLLAATQRAEGARPDWGLYDGRWLYFELPPQPRDPKAPLEGYNFSAPPSLLARPMVPTGETSTSSKNGDQPAMRQAVVTDGTTESFYLKVNGVPMFVKGGNLIPFTLFPTNDTYAQIERTLGAALAANHNMVRVWGGGIYPSDATHDLADEKGLLIWEEAMFACTLYPTAQPGFLSNVRAELEEQVRRLAGRPSVAVWAGNNEVEGSFDWFAPSRDNRMLYAVDYHELFVRTIGGIIGELAPGLSYVDSSPMNGYVGTAKPTDYAPSAIAKKAAAIGGAKKTTADGAASANAAANPVVLKRWGRTSDERYGDVHFYNYAFDCQSAREFPQAKFVSEFGFLSVPNFKTWSEATDPKLGDWEFGNFSQTAFGVNNTMTNYRSRRYSHINEILNQAGRHFRLPPKWRLDAKPGASVRAQATAKRETTRLYKQFFWLTNQQQAACYKTGTAAWRRQRSEANALTMGVLYWQLNDVWAGWSWSGYDWAGRWKPMHYALKREFAPLVAQVWFDPTSDKIEVFAVSDEPVASEDAKLTVTLRRILYGAQDANECSKSGRPAAVAKVWKVDNVQVPAAASARVWSMGADELLSSAEGCTRELCYVTAELEASYPEAGGEAALRALAEAARVAKAAAANKEGEVSGKGGGKNAKAVASETATLNNKGPVVAADAPRPRVLKSEGEAFFRYWKDLDFMPEAQITYSPLRFLGDEDDDEDDANKKSDNGTTKAKATKMIKAKKGADDDADEAAASTKSNDKNKANKASSNSAKNATIAAASAPVKGDNRTVVIDLKEAYGATAVLVTLDTPVPGHFSENFFTLHSAGDGVNGRSCEEDGETKRVYFYADEPIASLEEFDNGLYITSLFDYQPIVAEELADSTNNGTAPGAPPSPPPAPEGDTPVGK